jgi:hypothetical protein
VGGAGLFTPAMINALSRIEEHEKTSFRGRAQKAMKKILILWAVLMIFTSACEKRSSAPEGKPEAASPPKASAGKEEDRMGETFSSEIKIKLKRDGKDNYSWELTGSDVDQILKADEKLRKHLGGTKNK